MNVRICTETRMSMRHNKAKPNYLMSIRGNGILFDDKYSRSILLVEIFMVEIYDEATLPS